MQRTQGAAQRRARSWHSCAVKVKRPPELGNTEISAPKMRNNAAKQHGRCHAVARIVKMRAGKSRVRHHREIIFPRQMKAGVGPNQQGRHQNAKTALLLGKGHLRLHLVKASGDHRIVMRNPPGFGIGRPDLVLNARDAVLEGMEMLVDQAVVILDDIKPASRIATAKLASSAAGQSQGFDRGGGKWPGFDAQGLADAGNSKARAAKAVSC